MTGSLLRRDLLAALLWVVVIVPPSFGFWLVAGSLAGVPAEDVRTLILAALLAVGITTLAQVCLGYRMPIFEGPASTYLGAVAVLGAAGGAAHPAQVTGGLLAAGVLVLVLGLAGADRPLRRLFTPPVLVAFLLIVVIAVVPATVERAIGHSAEHPLGTVAAWTAAAVVVAVALGSQRVSALRPYGLLAALLLGTLTYFLLAGFPGAGSSSGWGVPDVFPWGAPELSFSIAIPFLIAGVLASLNTMASIDAMAGAREAPPGPGAGRRALLTHGGAGAATACFGNLLGNVPRLDSAGVVRMIGNPRPRALGFAAAAIFALAFVGPAVDLLARIPVAVSAALLAVVLGLVVDQGLRQAAGFEPRRRWLVVAPAVVPTLAWLLVGDQLSAEARLVANPLLLGVLLAVALDRLVPRDLNHPAARAAS